MDWNIKSLYLCVLDMDRAITFYEDLLEFEDSKGNHIEITTPITN